MRIAGLQTTCAHDEDPVLKQRDKDKIEEEESEEFIILHFKSLRSFPHVWQYLGT